MTPDIDLDALTALVDHLDEWDGECDCGIEQVTAVEQQLLTMFDAWYGDKAYRKHDEIIGWAAKLTEPLLSALTANRAERDDYQGRHVNAELLLAATERERDAARAEAEMWQRQVEALTKSAGEYMKVRDAEADHLRAALADCVVKATPFGEQDGGFIANYVMPTGPIHRAIPLLQESGITVRPGFDGREAAPAAAPQPICGDTTFGEVCAKPAGHVEAGDTWHERADQLAAAPQPDDERWTWAVSCPGCGQTKGHPCIGALGGDGAVHPERRGRAVAFGYGLNAAAGAGDGEQATATTEPLAECQRTGTCCSTCINDFGDCCKHNPDIKPKSLFRDCPVCGGEVRGVGVDDSLATTFLPCRHVEPHEPAPASVQGAADGEAQA